MYDFTQSTIPGCRTPHVWLRDGRSLYDALGPEFTLLRSDSAVETRGLVAAADQRGATMQSSTPVVASTVVRLRPASV